MVWSGARLTVRIPCILGQNIVYLPLTEVVLRYHDVRIDAVHYCEREAELIAKRKGKPFNGRIGGFRDPPQERLQLFCRTVRENNRLAHQVKSLKTPYMTREMCKADLARIVSVLPNLCHVDLPDGFFSDSPSSSTLKRELQTHCPSIRRMKYVAGAEESFASLAQTRHWRLLEDLELCRLGTDTAILLHVLQSLPALCTLELADLVSFGDNALMASPANDPLPPLNKIKLKGLKNVSVNGLTTYLSRQDVSLTMTSLTISDTGIQPSSLHLILASCPKLRAVHLSETVRRPFPIAPIPLLSSRFLRTLNYEISVGSSDQHIPKSASESYYRYVAKSITDGLLPALTHLYALSTSLPAMLLQLSNPELTGSSLSTVQSTQKLRLKHALNLYTKAVSELEWNLTSIDPESSPDHSRSSAITRPLSMYRAPHLSPQWRDKGRESVMVGNGFGGFLTVPTQDEGPTSPRKNSSRTERDAWMG